MKSNFSVKYYVTKNYGLDYQERLVTSINAPYYWDPKKPEMFPNSIKRKTEVFTIICGIDYFYQVMKMDKKALLLSVIT